MTMHWPIDRTLFQEGQGWDARFDLHTDAAIVYGIDGSLPQRVAEWRAHGYRVHLMTGLAWGHYQDYLLGRWDGVEHWDEAQRLADGRPKLHGQDIPYMVPSTSYAAYLESLLLRAVDAGVEAIFLEEPEFWSYTGYGGGFEHAWAAYHGTPYEDPGSSPHAFTQGAQVKYALYRDLIARLFHAVKHYGSSRPGGAIPCFVATHSLLNYTHNRIVSPHAALRDIAPCDGVILQVWSHTARSQVVYEGRKAERMFEVAFLEYGSGLDLVRGSERALWFLADPVEDHPEHGWDRYRAGYEVTIAASLFHPEVGAYEVMPWPSRVFTGRYPRRPNSPPGDLIPPTYAAEVLAVANALSDMPYGPLEWDCGTQGVGVLVADNMMFRRDGPQHDDPELSAFYGLALPLLIAGMPVRPVSMEVLPEAGVPDELCVLLLSYDGMTPPGPQTHDVLARWVRAGNALICFGTGDGPYEMLPGWWNDDHPPCGPWPDLFRRLGMEEAPHVSVHRCDNGVVLTEHEGPISLARRASGAGAVRETLRRTLEALGPSAPAYREHPYMLLRRGQYVVAAVPAESSTGPAALHLPGHYLDLFDGDLPMRDGVDVQPGSHVFLLDPARLELGIPRVLAASARITLESTHEGTLRFRAAGPVGTPAVIRMALPSAPVRATKDEQRADIEWDEGSHTALLRFPNVPAGVTCVVEW